MKKKEEKKIKKCKNCGGNLVFSPSLQSLFCNHCESSYEIEKDQTKSYHDVLTTVKPNEKDDVFLREGVIFNCENCGGQIVLTSNEFAKKCPYCGGYNIQMSNENITISPDSIIPFEIEKERAAELYVAAMKKKHFIPNAFKKSPPIDDIYGVYIPTMSYNADSNSTYFGEIREEHTKLNSDGLSETYYTYRRISGSISEIHRNVLVESSSYMNQLEFESVSGFDYSKLYTFDEDFVRGFYVEYHSSPLKVCTEVAHTIMRNQIERAIKSKYRGKDVVNLRITPTFKNEIFSYYLLPVYKCDYVFKNKHYSAFINGQTGRVGGFPPKSKLKISLLVISLILLFGAFISLFFIF